jgi:hypothetical protein
MPVLDVQTSVAAAYFSVIFQKIMVAIIEYKSSFSIVESLGYIRKSNCDCDTIGSFFPFVDNQLPLI